MKKFLGVSIAVHVLLFGVAAWKVGVFGASAIDAVGTAPNYPVEVVSLGERIQTQRAAVARASKMQDARASVRQNAATPSAPAESVVAKAAPSDVASAYPVTGVALEEVAGDYAAGTELTIADYAAYVRKHNDQPEYPRSARMRGERGRVVVRAVISASGVLASLELDQSSGSETLDLAAMDCVRKWTFPKFKNLTEIALRIPFRFDLD